jgi:cysteine-rich repeat protein
MRFLMTKINVERNLSMMPLSALIRTLISVGLLLAASACGGSADNPGSHRSDASANRESGIVDVADAAESDSATEDASTGVVDSICGNEITEGLEQCDDGNSIDSDGCTNLCEFTCEDDQDCDDLNPCNGEEYCADKHQCDSRSGLR